MEDDTKPTPEDARARVKALVDAVDRGELGWPGAYERADADGLALDLIRESSTVRSSAGEPAEARIRSSWEPVDIAALLARGLKLPEPSVLRRTDGAYLLYPGKTHAFVGKSESCKSFAAYIASVEVLADGGNVIYLDFETEAAYVISNFMALGADAEVLKDEGRFAYIRPEEASSGTGLGIMVDALGGRRSGLTVIDGVDQALTLEGREPNSRRDVGEWWHQFVLPLKVGTDGPLVTIDHPVKNAEGVPDHASGAGNKKNLIDVQIMFVSVQPFGYGKTGISKLHVIKDRPGGLRQYAEANKHLATLRLVSTGKDDPIAYVIEPPEPRASAASDFRPTHLMERVSRYVEDAGEPTSQHRILEDVPGKRQAKIQAVKVLASEGYLAEEVDSRGNRVYRSATSYREDNEVLGFSAVPGSSQQGTLKKEPVPGQFPSSKGTGSPRPGGTGSRSSPTLVGELGTGPGRAGEGNDTQPSGQSSFVGKEVCECGSTARATNGRCIRGHAWRPARQLPLDGGEEVEQ